MAFVPTSFQAIFLAASDVFTQPSFQNFMVVVSGWICCSGRHTITRVLRAAWPYACRKHFSAFYRFFSRAEWSLDELGRILFHLCLPWIPGPRILAVVDDTLHRKSGPHVFGAAMHHDAGRSSYGRLTSAARHVAFAFGHRFVILAIYVPLPWNSSRGVALPILFRLYRGKKRTPESDYSKATELARELVGILASWLPEDRKLTITADCEYACQTLVRSLPRGVEFVGPVLARATLYAVLHIDPNKKRPRGNPRKRGRRLSTLARWAQDKRRRWTRTVLKIYRQEISVLYKTRVCLWYRVAYTRPVRVVLVRDPRGRYKDQAYFSTDLSLTPEQIVEEFARRWSLEVTFRDTKQHLGLEDPQNGWWRRCTKILRYRKKKPGPQPHATRGSKAVHRTAPLALISYAFAYLWYFEHGNAKQDVREAKKLAPWYRQKTEPSFTDVLGAARREYWTEAIKCKPRVNSASSLIARMAHFLGIAA